MLYRELELASNPVQEILYTKFGAELVAIDLHHKGVIRPTILTISDIRFALKNQFWHRTD